MKKKGYRIGVGLDLHRFSKKKKPLVLAGVKIPSKLSLDAVSDGDVVLHAIADALCGAASLGDIGDYFPPGDKKSKGIDSKDIVKKVLSKLNKKQILLNIDVTIISDKPKLVSYKPKMLKSLKSIFNCRETNLKIKSKEKTDFIGSKDAISAVAAVMTKVK